MTAEDRIVETKQLLDRIHRARGTAYTLGLLMGIIARLSRHDWDLYTEIKVRAERAEAEARR